MRLISAYMALHAARKNTHLQFDVLFVHCNNFISDGRTSRPVDPDIFSFTIYIKMTDTSMVRCI
jgi:hypothetical protein